MSISSRPALTSNMAVFFDRDGTLNVDVHYLHRVEDFQWMPGARDAVRYVNNLGYLAIIITNQSGVARGYYPEEDVQTVHDWMNTELAKNGAHLDALYYCPHLVGAKLAAYDRDCTCRKPKTGMVDAACTKYAIDRSASFLVGDSEKDILCAKDAGIMGLRYARGSLYDLVASHIR